MSNLYTITEFIDKARALGINFGNGDPKIHLAYLTKIGLLPQTTRRKINGCISGCYPQESLSTLIEIENLKNKGFSLAQISKSLNSNKPSLYQPFTPVFDSNFSIPQKSTSPAVLFLIIGILIGFLMANFNSQTMANMNKVENMALSAKSGLTNFQSQTNQTLNAVSGNQQPIYVIAIPKQNLDKMDKTDIKYLIQN